MKTIALTAVFAAGLLNPAFGYEPDVSQEDMEWDVHAPNDRLIPTGSGRSDTGIGQLYYLAKFGRYPSFEDAYEWCLEIKERKYLLTSWRYASSSRDDKEAHKLDEKSREISKELASTIYTIWANAILEARYDRSGSGLDGTSYWFSTWLRGVGWPSARTWSPSANLPPKWMVDAGELVLAFGRGKIPNEAATISALSSIRSHLEGYWEKNAQRR